MVRASTGGCRARGGSVIARETVRRRINLHEKFEKVSSPLLERWGRKRRRASSQAAPPYVEPRWTVRGAVPQQAAGGIRLPSSSRVEARAKELSERDCSSSIAGSERRGLRDVEVEPPRCIRIALRYLKENTSSDCLHIHESSIPSRAYQQVLRSLAPNNQLAEAFPIEMRDRTLRFARLQF